jgi:hypothetical protein
MRCARPRVGELRIVGLVAAVLGGLVGCKSDGGGRADGGPADGGPKDSAVGNLHADRGLDSGAPAVDAAVEAGGLGAVHDCYPGCIESLRQTCERPLVDAGSCTFVNADGGNRICYSNGIHENDVPAGDGGLELAIFTTSDGHTICYQVLVSADGIEHFQTPSGQEVGQLTALGNGMYRETCNGVSQDINGNDPTCETLNESSCTGTVSCP